MPSHWIDQLINEIPITDSARFRTALSSDEKLMDAHKPLVLGFPTRELVSMLLGYLSHTLSLSSFVVSIFLALFEKLVFLFRRLASRCIISRSIHKKFLVRVYLAKVPFNGSIV